MIFDQVSNGVVVICHPDDEVMWAGGLLARYGERFTVICCSIPRSDPERAWKFFDACDVFGAKARLLPIVETEKPLNIAHVDLSGFDMVVTHNAAGEYGHHHHMALHQSLKPLRPVTFGYRPDGRGSIALHLTADEQARRMAALQCYDHVSPHDSGKPKWQALLDRYAIDLRVETFNPPDA